MVSLFDFSYYQICDALLKFLNPQTDGMLIFFRASAKHLMVLYERQWMPVFIEQIYEYLSI